MPTSSAVQDVMHFLKQRSIVTSVEWVSACIDFVEQEISGQNLSNNVLNDSVYQQWLTADLEEIGVPALSSELSTSQKTTLNGSFALQVNGIRDVGKPAYAQMKDLDKSRIRNDEFSAADRDVSIPAWEAKPTRMLMLNLTDGCTTVQGMEYKPINFLSVTLSPGVKVLIQGPVDCRLGVLLLTPEKIKVLGGEVESKLEQYSQRAILREILHLPPEEIVSEENAPGINNAEINNMPEINSINNVYHNVDSQQSTSTNVSSSSNFRDQSTSSRFSNRNLSSRQRNPFTRNPTSGQTRNITHYLQSSSGNSNQTRNQSNHITGNLDDFENEEDDFVQSLDYNAIDEIEREVSLTQADNSANNNDEGNIWNEDEDVLQDMFAFQDEAPELEIPSEIMDTNQQTESESRVSRDDPFTYLSTVLKEKQNNALITIKGFIMRVLSKLECTVDKGWNLSVQINDGSATLEASIHDKVLEGIIGISAVDMVRIQKQAATDMQKRTEAMEAISKCKVTLQDYNCLMDIQFSPNCKPCIMKCHPVTLLHIKQLMERTKSYF